MVDDPVSEHARQLEGAGDANPFNELQPIGETRVAPAVGVAALALTMALKYHDINTVQDGTLYQQYKLEGKNMRALHLDHVFETALRMELYLLGASERIAKVVVEAALNLPPDDGNEKQETEQPAATGGETP